MIADRRAAQVRGTQSLVDQMGWMLRRPAIVAVEVGWRWLFGIPFLLVCWSRLAAYFAVLPPEESGLSSIDPQNPWVAAGQFSRAVTKYEPLIAHELRWLVPVAALAWIVISGWAATLLQAHGARAALSAAGDDGCCRPYGWRCLAASAGDGFARSAGRRPRIFPRAASRT